MTDQPQKIILGVTGGIAAYKAADLCSKLVQAGASVRVAFSPSAHQFIAPLVFEALCGHPVYRQVLDTPVAYQMEHISWARWADCFVIAPASADTLARLATGQANDPLSTLYLAYRGNVFVAPSMNTAMLDHEATRANLATLQQRGVQVIAPGAGSLACGETGSGRMAEPAEIMAHLGFRGISPGEQPPASASGRATDTSLEGITVLITSGPTREYLDPVRFISSPSSGRMGKALAEDAVRRGAKVHFVTGPVSPDLLPGGCEIHGVESATEMMAVVNEWRSTSQLCIFAAAVGDFRPAQTIDRKIKRTGNSISLPLVENPDIAQSVGFSKQPDQVLIGFAAETNDHDNNAQGKMAAKRLDAIVINDVANPEIGFSSTDNEIRIVTASGESRNVSRRSKAEVAFEILEVAVELLHER